MNKDSHIFRMDYLNTRNATLNFYYDILTTIDDHRLEFTVDFKMSFLGIFKNYAMFCLNLLS